MRKFLLALSCSMTIATAGGSDAVRAADTYQMDPVHTAVTFKVSHLGLSWTHGRFNEVSGSFAIDSADPGRSSFTLSMRPESVQHGQHEA